MDKPSVMIQKCNLIVVTTTQKAVLVFLLEQMTKGKGAHHLRRAPLPLSKRPVKPWAKALSFTLILQLISCVSLETLLVGFHFQGKRSVLKLTL